MLIQACVFLKLWAYWNVCLLPDISGEGTACVMQCLFFAYHFLVHLTLLQFTTYKHGMFTSVSIFVFLVSYPKLGDLCWLVVPSALTTRNHWSPEVKVQFLLLVYTWLYIFRFLYDNILFLSLIQFLNCALWYPF